MAHHEVDTESQCQYSSLSQRPSQAITPLFHGGVQPFFHRVNAMGCDHLAQTSDSHDHSVPGDLGAIDHVIAPIADGTSCPVESRTESAAPPRTIGSEELLQGHREVLILHAGETYRLRLTRNGKLILNK